jgi:hypothetical protein
LIWSNLILNTREYGKSNKCFEGQGKNAGRTERYLGSQRDAALELNVPFSTASDRVAHAKVAGHQRGKMHFQLKTREREREMEKNVL